MKYVSSGTAKLNDSDPLSITILQLKFSLVRLNFGLKRPQLHLRLGT